MKIALEVMLVLVSLFRIDVVYSGQPVWELWGNPDFIRYAPEEHVWINHNTSIELWRLGSDFTKPERTPEKKKLELKLNEFFWRRENPTAVMACAFAMPSRRLKLINVEESINEMRAENAEFRTWPHLGLLYVGTVADNEGWEVTLHDELVEGYVDLARFVKPGDVVGLSLVATGMNRGIELARRAKHLGASHVVAGNDSAAFRANQLLRIPDHPIDAVFMTNSLTSVREFLHQIESAEFEKVEIPGVAIIPSETDLSNKNSVLRAERKFRSQLRKQGKFDQQDVFVIPKLSLYKKEYWQKVWRNYRTIFGHKHINPAEVHNGIALFAQGCTRASGCEACSYCTILGVSDVRIPTRKYLAEVLETYRSFGINYVLNATDSVFEMRNVLSSLKELKAFFHEGLMIYGRAWGLAYSSKLIDEWLSLTGGRLLINVGMDSGDDRILNRGIVKSSWLGSRSEENRQAVQNIRASGAHLHYSLIFGSPGETQETCEKTLEFFEWTRSTLGDQLDQCEADIYWLNHGSPASRIFHDYEYAQKLASLAGKEILRKTWETRFYRHRDTLVVPWECEEAWYECFTSITIEGAQECNARIAKAMAMHKGAAPGREIMFRGAFKPS